MYNINQNYQKAINAPSRRVRGRVTIKNKVLSDGVSSIDYISSITGNEISIGSTNASTVDIKFKTLIEGLQERELIKVSFTVETESGLVERQIGEFYLTEIKLDRNNKTTVVKAIDKMAFLNDQFKSTISYPALGKNIVQEIVNDCNLRVNNNLYISNLPSFDKKLEKVSYREMLGFLAQTVGAFVVFNNRGELEFRKLTRTEKRISKSAYLLKGLEVDEVEFRINGISVDLKDKEKKILVMGSPLGTQVNLSNPLMTQGVLNSIYSEYKNLRFNPFKLNWRGDPFVEVGDWVSIEVSNGTYKAFPVLSLKISFSGGLKSTISANVKGTASLTTEYKGTIQRQIEFINARLGATGNLVYADTTEPKNPSEGDVWFKPNGAFTDLYIFEKGKWVLKTSTGDIEGVVTQITKSEILTKNFAAAIAKIIELDANRITTGSLSFEKLSSKAVNSIREGLITRSKLSELLATDEGIHQILLSEVNKEIEKKKPELKGKDGKIPAFNQIIGSRFPTLDVVKPVENTQLKLNKKDYNNQNSIEVLPNAGNELQGFSFKVNIRDIAPGRKYVMRIPIYVFSDSGNNTEIKLGFPGEDGQFHLWLAIPLIEVPKGENKWVIVEKEMPIASDIEVQQFVKSNFAFISTGNAHFKIAEPYMAISDVVTDKWLPAIEDMQSYSLTASARIEGSYLNENLMNCKVFLDIYSNGEIVRASTTETPLKIEIKKLVASGYTASGQITLDSNGLVQNINIPNGLKDGQPIEVVFEVTYGENKTVASARLNNTIDKQLLTETISKVKTFESTIDKFESKIGEINKQKFKMAYNIENICSESGVEKKGNDLYFNAKTPLKKDKEYYITAFVSNAPDNQKTRVYNAKNDYNKELVNGFNIWRISYASDQTRINLFPLGSETKVSFVEILEVPEYEPFKENILKSFNQSSYKQGTMNISVMTGFKKNNVYTVEFEIIGNVPAQSYLMRSFNDGTVHKKSLSKGINVYVLKTYSDFENLSLSIPKNLEIKNVKIFNENLYIGYKNEYNISEMESKINQTKEQIELSVKKNEFGTILTQNAEYLRLAWNNISKFIQFENGGMSFYEGGDISQNKLTARITDTSYQFWRDGYKLGNIGTNRYKYDTSKKGIVFDMDYDGWYMAWGYQDNKNDTVYTWKWLYTSGSFADYNANTLNAGCPVDMHWFNLRRVKIDLDDISFNSSITSTFNFAVATSFSQDGTANQWFDNCYLQFKNGILINASMPH